MLRTLNSYLVEPRETGTTIKMRSSCQFSENRRNTINACIFQFAVRLFNLGSEMTGKGRGNKTDFLPHLEPNAFLSQISLPHFDVFCDV